MKILIADDDAVSLQLLREILARDKAHEIITAKDGEEAWTLLAQGQRPDLCFLDIMMPNLDGISLLKRIRGDQRLKNLSVIFCTTLNDRATVTQAAALSIDYFILKPYARRTVLDQVQKVKQALGASTRLESPSAANDRLGIELPIYCKLLQTLADEVPKVVHSIEQSMDEGSLQTALLKLNALRGAALNLAANGLVSEVSRVEMELLTHQTKSTASEIEAKEKFQMWTTNHKEVVADGLTGLKRECEFLVSELDRNLKLLPAVEPPKPLAQEAAA